MRMAMLRWSWLPAAALLSGCGAATLADDEDDAAAEDGRDASTDVPVEDAAGPDSTEDGLADADDATDAGNLFTSGLIAWTAGSDGAEPPKGQVWFQLRLNNRGPEISSLRVTGGSVRLERDSGLVFAFGATALLVDPDDIPFDGLLPHGATLIVEGTDSETLTDAVPCGEVVTLAISLTWNGTTNRFVEGDPVVFGCPD
jgi:hypothetical protein